LGLKVRVDLADIWLGVVESGSEISYYTVWIGWTQVKSSRELRTKWRAWFSVALTLVMSLQFLPTPVAGADAPTSDYIVLFSADTDLQPKLSKEARLGNAISDVYDGVTNGFVAELDAADVRRLKADRDVVVLELDRVIRLDTEGDSTSSTTSTTVAPSSTSSTSTTVAPSSTTS
jgi:hypothetical protein